jgi:hypothetical protein
VDDAFLRDLGVTKGSRTLISHTQRSEVLSRLDGESYVCHAGGSLSNTLVALSRLSGGTARVSLAADVGSDALGGFYRAQMRAAGVHVCSASSSAPTEALADESPSGTGTVVVLTTPDAQRTMLAYLPASGSEAALLGAQDVVATASDADLLLVEGYLLEQHHTVGAICDAIAAARSGGALVALTCADVGVVRAHGDAFRAVLAAGVDVVFANAEEGMQLVHASDAHDAAQALALCATIAVVTDGSRGAYLATAGGACVEHAPPFWMPDAPVDTCGAGDAYAAGVLHGLLKGASLQHAGTFAARVAAAVIARHGARLDEADAASLASLFPGHPEPPHAR